MSRSLDPEHLRSRLGELLAEHDVPGAAFGILRDGEIVEVAAGVINLNTGVEATPDTVFQIGSQGKMWTATVLMQFVDEGVVDLDAPVRTYLPDFRVADPDVTERVTLRHLLCHSSGIDGDHFEDTGRGDDCLGRYVDSCVGLQQTHELGATMSYCNTGYSIIGRMMEVLTGKVWNDVMRERLFEPLGLTHTSLLAEEAILHRAAVGHIAPAPGESLVVTPTWSLFRACGPMGGENATVRDVLTFARLHLDGGRTHDGTQLVSEDGIRAMQQPQIEVPDRFTFGSHWGLGETLFEWDGHPAYGHDGGTIGQSSRLRIFPEANAALTLLTCGGETEEVYRALFSEVLSELMGITVPPRLQAPETPPKLDLSKYEGTYQRLAVRYDLVAEDGHLAGTVTLSGPLAEIVPDTVTKLTLTPVDAETFLAVDEGSPSPEPAVFYGFEDGRPTYLHNGARANRRV
jgi:CubicO group peptidase (beta-lactamase class C family)